MGRIYKRDGRFGIDYSDHRGKRIRKVVATDKSVALRLLAEAMETAEKIAAGMLLADPKEATRPLQQHLDAYAQDLKRRGRDTFYIYVVGKRLEAAAFAQEWECLKDCTSKSVADYLTDLADDGRAPRTVDQYRSGFSAFFTWCVRQGALAANPCEQVQKTTLKIEKKRRALSVQECRALLAAAPESRRIVYLTMLYTGLRRAEAAALRWGDVRLEVANPHLELPPAITKSGHAESVPLVPEVARALAAHRRGAVDERQVFDEIPSMEEFRADLLVAEIADQDGRGRKVVLHSLRHSLATMLAQSQVPPAVAMRIMRHRDIRLTLEAYCDEGLLPLSAAMGSLPSIAEQGGNGPLRRQA